MNEVNYGKVVSWPTEIVRKPLESWMHDREGHGR
jgi:hypothetical protein